MLRRRFRRRERSRSSTAGRARGWAACTIAAKHEWPLARVTAESFAEHHPGVPFYALLADEPGEGLRPDAEPFEVLSLRALDLQRRRSLLFRYPRQPLSYALPPHLLEHVLDRGHDRAVFLKQESLVTGSLDAVLTELRQSSIALTPHLLEPLEGGGAPELELSVMLAGAYNGGIVGVADRPQGRAFLEWWRDRAETHCVHDVAHGLHYEQRWLDLVLGYFDETAIIRDPGCNVGHWNLGERDLRVRDGRVVVRDGPCSLVRFSGFDPGEPARVSKHRDLFLEDVGAAAEVWRLYAARLRAAGRTLTADRGYAYGRFSNGAPISDLARAVYRELGANAERFGDPFAVGEGSYHEWLHRPVDGERDGADRPVSRLFDALYRRRPDLQRAFPDHRGADHAGFLAWAAAHAEDGL